MSRFEKRAIALRVLLAVAGFMVGYVLGVGRWAGQTGVDTGAYISASYMGALVPAFACAAMVGLWIAMDVGRGYIGRSRLDIASPISFLFSFVAGMGGIRAALWLVV